MKYSDSQNYYPVFYRKMMLKNQNDGYYRKTWLIYDWFGLHKRSTNMFEIRLENRELYCLLHVWQLLRGIQIKTHLPE